MLDPKLEDELMKEIKKNLGQHNITLSCWTEDSFKSLISIYLVRSYQEGQRNAFLAMGRFMQK